MDYVVVEISGDVGNLEFGIDEKYMVSPARLQTTSILEMAKNESKFNFQLFPNPSNGFVNISIEKNTLQTISSIEITDLSGKLVKSPEMIKKGSSNIRIDVSDLPVGVYLVRMQLGEAIYSRKLILKE